MIKAIVFDWYGVCTVKPWRVTFSEELAERLGFGVEDVMEVFRKFVHDYEKGIVPGEDFIDLVLGNLDSSLDPAEFYYLIESQPEIDGVVMDFIKVLKEKYKMFLFSDNYVEVVDKMKSDLGDLGLYFDDCLFSFDVGMRKNEKGMYELLLEKVGVNPSEIVFIDDQEKNLNLAKTLGLNCVLFQNFDQLIGDLKKLGVLV